MSSGENLAGNQNQSQRADLLHHYSAIAGGSKFRRAGPLLSCLSLVWFLAGCGVDDYDKNMQATRERLDRFDRLLQEESKYLGELLDIPRKEVEEDRGKEGKVKKEVIAIPVSFFLRPPKGVSAKADPPRGLVFRYAGSEGVTLYIAGTTEPSKELVFEKKVFQTVIPMAFSGKLGSVHISGFGPKSTEFGTISQRFGGSTYQFYFHTAGSEELAVVYQFDNKRTNDLEMKNAIDASLRCLVMGSMADLVNLAYRNSKPEYYNLRLNTK